MGKLKTDVTVDVWGFTVLGPMEGPVVTNTG